MNHIVFEPISKRMRKIKQNSITNKAKSNKYTIEFCVSFHRNGACVYCVFQFYLRFTYSVAHSVTEN